MFVVLNTGHLTASLRWREERSCRHFNKIASSRDSSFATTVTGDKRLCSQDGEFLCVLT